MKPQPLANSHSVNQKKMHELFNYNPETGIIKWKKSRGGKLAGSLAGSVGDTGYLNIMINGTTYKAHRLIWLYSYGYLPEHQIDHINRVRDDNKLSNLRAISPQCNTRNCKLYNNNTSGIKGVSVTKNGRWKARIVVDYKSKHLGIYKSIENAACARLAAEQCLNWSNCESNSPAYQYVKNILRRANI